MMGRTHALTGAAAWAVLAAAGGVHGPLPVLGGGAVCTVAALLPDLDSVGSAAARSLGFASKGVAYIVRGCSGGHRHGTHSLLGGGVFPGLVLWADSLAPVMAGFPVPLVAAVGLGAGVHIAGDMLTVHGCPLLWPFTLRRFWLLPKALRISTGGRRRGRTRPGRPVGEWAVRTLSVLAVMAAAWLKWRHG
jgi:membrane-bound metal-dependent hydrolase YbcI (DUF457 family)